MGQENNVRKATQIKDHTQVITKKFLGRVSVFGKEILEKTDKEVVYENWQFIGPNGHCTWDAFEVIRRKAPVRSSYEPQSAQDYYGNDSGVHSRGQYMGD